MLSFQIFKQLQIQCDQVAYSNIPLIKTFSFIGLGLSRLGRDVCPPVFYVQSPGTWLQWGTARPSHACDQSTPTPTSELLPPPATWTRACRTSTSMKRVRGRKSAEEKNKNSERESFILNLDKTVEDKLELA